MCRKRASGGCRSFQLLIRLFACCYLNAIVLLARMLHEGGRASLLTRISFNQLNENQGALVQ